MIIQNLIALLDEWAPKAYAEDFDNVGLLLGDSKEECSGVLVSLDCTEKIVEEAIKNKCNLIVCFHPIIFSGLKKINGKNYVERVVIKAIQNKISVFALHTRLDNHPTGVNYTIEKQLGLIKSRVLIPKDGRLEVSEIGMGRIGELTSEMPELDFLDFVKFQLNTDLIRHSKLSSKKIKKVAFLGGSGSFAIENAKKQGADAFITSDLKYHQFFQSENNFLLVDIGHYESEQFTKNLIYDYLMEKLPNFAIILSNIITNPVNYF
jgi:dinuclear metal center YbgI/SA1388 family protein